MPERIPWQLSNRLLGGALSLALSSLSAAVSADFPESLLRLHGTERSAQSLEWTLVNCNGESCTDATECGEVYRPTDTWESLCEKSTLVGDWCGLRSGAAESGISFDLSTTQYYQGVSSGGIREDFEYGGRNDYFLNIDGQKAGLWKGLMITLHGETRYGDAVYPQAGALMPPNLAVMLPEPTGTQSALSGVKVMQFLSEELLVFAGKINTFDDFHQPLTGAGATSGFMNGSLMLNPNLVRTVPYSAYGAGLVVLQNMEPVFSVAVFDSNSTPTTSGFDSFFDNGASIVSQVTIPTTFCCLPGHQGLLGTYSSGSYTNLSPTVYYNPGAGVVVQSPPKDGSWSLGYNADQAFWVSPTDPRKRWGVFGGLGVADDNPSPIQWFANAGVAGTSPIAGRQGDTFGAGYFYTGVSDALKDFAPVLLPLSDEQGVELYYNVAVTPWCHITPDVQFIDPFRDRADAAVLFGLRGKIDF
jgi:porin